MATELRMTPTLLNIDRTLIQLISGRAPDGSTVVSVVFGRRFSVDRCTGRCEPIDEAWTLSTDPEYYDHIQHPGKYRPSLLERDLDVWAWRSFTDLVVQGTARSDKLVDSLAVQLQCNGSDARFEQNLIATGDRRVERGPTGLRLSSPERFLEMPMRYDKAYGGTDEAAEVKLGDPDELRFYEIQLSEEADLEMSPFSYPRNPAGKGYVVDEDSVLGLSWPNIEFPEDRLSFSNLVKPLEVWGSRPYPAGLDWFSHAWFPRLAFFGEYMPTEGNKVPEAEVQRKILPPDLGNIPLLLRPKHGFAQGAHPFLARRRLVGDETITVSAMSLDGRSFLVRLPGLRPAVKLHAADCRGQSIDPSLDLVFLETDLSRLTLVWRSTWMTQLDRLPVGWDADARADVQWR